MMNDIKEEDIEILDKILVFLLHSSSGINASDLASGNIFNRKDKNKKTRDLSDLQSELNYYLPPLKKYCADTYKKGYYYFISPNEYTQSFYENGGFKNQYKINKNRELNEEMKFQKLNLEICELKRGKRIDRIVSIMAIIIAITGIVISICL